MGKRSVPGLRWRGRSRGPPAHARPMWVEQESSRFTPKALGSHGRSKRGNATVSQCLKKTTLQTRVHSVMKSFYSSVVPRRARSHAPKTKISTSALFVIAANYKPLKCLPVLD